MHVGGHLRDAFVECVENGMESKPEIDDEPVDLKWLLGRLWNCSDIMPGDLCYDLQMMPGSTYAMAAHRLMKAIAAGDEPTISATADEWNED